MLTLAGITPVITIQNEIRHRIKQAMRTPKGSLDNKLAWDHVEDLKKKLKKLQSGCTEVDCEMDPLACREYDV
jgi:hypothetical protein